MLIYRLVEGVAKVSNKVAISRPTISSSLIGRPCKQMGGAQLEGNETETLISAEGDGSCGFTIFFALINQKNWKI